MDTILEETKKNRKFLVEQLRNEIERYYDLGQSNFKLTKKMNTDIAENFKFSLKEYSKILMAKLEKGTLKKLIESNYNKKFISMDSETINKEVNIKLEKFNGCNKAIVVCSVTSAFGIIGSTLVKLYVEGAVISEIALPTIVGVAVGFASYRYISKKERIQLKKNIDSYFDNLEKLLESYTIEYCKVYEKKRNMLI
ncbi:hypothetical protein N2W52_000008 [Clostridium perfringens]|uniref:hypothetical protein n=1 Tax=Clostridium perfringens TaxID=1502 RepID=UPI001158DD29|nr:hypothetical protein [Clostridium perfringens]EJT5935283.1 hypothetical protein [Clostridium perfringens]HAT4080047.1 hypothetical protein [Clostridium perfringens]HAT4087750.1 hypothetical protein [Clostridium perfringens]HBC2054213.1 hypothetical protein [Clostridium perfringens]